MMSRMVRCVNARQVPIGGLPTARTTPSSDRSARLRSLTKAESYSAAMAKDGSGAKASLWRRFTGTPRLSRAASVAVMKPIGPQ